MLDVHTVLYLLFEVTYYMAPKFRDSEYKPMLSDLLRRGYRFYQLQAMGPMSSPRRGAITSARCSRRSECEDELGAWLKTRISGCRGAIDLKKATTCQLDIFAVHPKATWPILS